MKISVDFCRGIRGPFLAINNLVVAGEIADGNDSELIQSFEIDGEALLTALQPRQLNG